MTGVGRNGWGFTLKASQSQDVRPGLEIGPACSLSKRPQWVELGHLTISIGYLCWNTRSRPKSAAELSKMEVRFG